jgi:hypothetical protein
MNDAHDDARLSQLQLWMAGAIRRRTALPHDPELAELARRELAGNERLSPVEQLEIYREQFWLRHTASLIDDFPGLAAITAQADFQRLLEEYLVRYPPQSFTLRDLGRQLAELVEQSDFLPRRELCADMARLEWSYVEVFDAADAPRLDPLELAKIPEPAWQSARIELAPALRLLALRHPVADLRRRIRAGSLPIELPAPETQTIVVYRRERELYDQRVEPGEFAILAALEAGMPLGAACARAIEALPEGASELETAIGPWFQRWAELGWIAGVRAD